MSILLNALRKKKQLDKDDDFSFGELSEEMENLAPDNSHFSTIDTKKKNKKIIFSLVLVIFLLVLIALGISLYALNQVNTLNREYEKNQNVKSETQESNDVKSSTNGQQENDGLNQDSNVVSADIIGNSQSKLAIDTPMGNASIGQVRSDSNGILTTNKEMKTKDPNETDNQDYLETYRAEEVRSITNKQGSSLAQQNESQSMSGSERTTANDQVYSSEQGYIGERATRDMSTGSLNRQLPIRNIEELNEVERLMINEIIIDAHVFSENPENRFIFLDDAIKVEGDQLVNSWYLEAIEANGVVVNNNILRVRIPQ